MESLRRRASWATMGHLAPTQPNGRRSLEGCGRQIGALRCHEVLVWEGPKSSRLRCTHVLLGRVWDKRGHWRSRSPRIVRQRVLSVALLGQWTKVKQKLHPPQ